MTTRDSKWIAIRTVILIALVFGLLANTNKSGESSESESVQSSLRKSTNVNVPDTHADVKFSYEKRRGYRGSAPKITALVSETAVYAIAEDLKKRIAFPFDIHVIFEECGDPDSFYEEGTHNITICYELIDVYYHLFSRTLRARTARDAAVKGAIVSMFLHEVGHALIDGWDFPVTGREEDAADQFSTLLLINGIPGGETMVLDGARSFRLLADQEKHSEKDYSDPHSLDEQRSFNTICLVYGHGPEKNAYLITNGMLPGERAFDCEEEYSRANKSWQQLLKPHLVADWR